MSIINFVENLELQDPAASFPQSRVLRKMEENAITETGEAEQSYVVGQSLVSFASGVSEKYRSDVLNSTLLAQMAANKKHSTEDKDTIKWYQSYIETLGGMGWVLEAGDVKTYEAKGSIIKVENVVIDIIVSAFGSNLIGIVTKTLEALKSDKEKKKWIAFETNSKSVQKGCFQIAMAVETNGTVMLQLGTFLLTATNEIHQILFFEFSRDKTRLEYANRRATLNEESYSKVREVIAQKLQDKVEDFVSRIEI